MMAKTQAVPFLLVALLVPLGLLLYQRNWRTAAMVAAGLASSCAILGVLLVAQQALLHDSTPPQTHIGSWFSLSVFVPVLAVRVEAIGTVLAFALPTLLGLSLAGWEICRQRGKVELDAAPDLVRLSLWVLAGSWLAWYILLAQSWPRYLVPVIPLAGCFTGALFWRANSRQPRLGDAIPRQGRKIVTWLMATVLLWSFFITAVALIGAYTSKADKNVLEVATFLNTHTPIEARIEASDAELYVLLNRRYQYPPVDEALAAVARKWVSQALPVRYDPLAGDPDYLVVGVWGRTSELYDQVLKGNAFGHLVTIGQYDIYKRHR
jgi:hypothetical protein